MCLNQGQDQGHCLAHLEACSEGQVSCQMKEGWLMRSHIHKLMAN